MLLLLVENPLGFSWKIEPNIKSCSQYVDTIFDILFCSFYARPLHFFTLN